jgi:GNAT superfamily N-acetyltransferase
VIHIRCMIPADVDLGMRLKEQAHWNQTPADWRRFLAMQPEGCFVAEYAGVAAGTAVVCLFDSVAWIAMVLVEESLRGRGIGKTLLQRALDFVDERGVLSVRLDATALGQPLYERLGFTPQYSLDRYSGRISGEGPSALAGFRPARSEDYPPMIELDRSATGCDRGKFLLHLFQEQPEHTYVLEREGQISGFSTVRAGSRAWQLGPCIAEPQAGIDVLRHALGRLSGEQVLLDVPIDNHQAAQLAQAAGLQVERRFLRMCRGPAIQDDLQRLWASSGPELG